MLSQADLPVQKAVVPLCGSNNCPAVLYAPVPKDGARWYGWLPWTLVQTRCGTHKQLLMHLKNSWTHRSWFLYTVCWEQKPNHQLRTKRLSWQKTWAVELFARTWATEVSYESAKRISSSGSFVSRARNLLAKAHLTVIVKTRYFTVDLVLIWRTPPASGLSSVHASW